MSDVIYLQRGHIEIDGGLVKSSSDWRLNGHVRIFVTYVDEDGGRFCLWDGPSMREAMTVARESAADFRTRIKNNLRGSR